MRTKRGNAKRSKCGTSSFLRILCKLQPLRERSAHLMHRRLVVDTPWFSSSCGKESSAAPLPGSKRGCKPKCAPWPRTHHLWQDTCLRKSAAVNEVNAQAKGRRIPTKNAGWLSWNGAKDGFCRSVVSMAESWQNAVSCKPQPSQSYHYISRVLLHEL